MLYSLQDVITLLRPAGRCPAGQAHSALLPLPPLPLFWRPPALATVSANLIDSVVDFKLREFTVGAGSSVVEPTASAKELIEILREFSDCSSFGSDIFGELQRLASLPRSKAPRRSMASRRWGTGIDSSSKIFETASLDGVKPVVRACVEGLGSPEVRLPGAGWVIGSNPDVGSIAA